MPLIVAINSMQYDLVKPLIEHGADINYLNPMALLIFHSENLSTTLENWEPFTNAVMGLKALVQRNPNAKARQNTHTTLDFIIHYIVELNTNPARVSFYPNTPIRMIIDPLLKAIYHQITREDRPKLLEVLNAAGTSLPDDPLDLIIDYRGFNLKDTGYAVSTEFAPDHYITKALDHGFYGLATSLYEGDSEINLKRENAVLKDENFNLEVRLARMNTEKFQAPGSPTPSSALPLSAKAESKESASEEQPQAMLIDYNRKPARRASLPSFSHTQHKHK